MTLSTTILACFLSMTPSYETSTQTQSFMPRQAIREVRPVAVSGELGWNGISGTGLLLSWSPSPHVSFDGGLGYSLSGPKVGIQGRYNVFKSNATPYVALSMGQTFGSYGEVDMDNYRMEVNPIRSAQATVGLSYVHANGFTLLAGLGYAMALQDEQYKVVSGTPNRNQRDVLGALFGSGPVASIALGYSFES